MKNVICFGGLIAICAGAAHAVPGDDEPCAIMVVDSDADRVSLLDAFDGSLINESWLDIAAAAAADNYTGSTTPIEAIEVGDEIWISDQLADRIWRFNKLDRSYVGSIGANSGELNNIRGMHAFGGTVYVAMGSDSDVYGQGIITIDAGSGAITGQFNGRNPDDTSYFDVAFYNGNLIVANIDTGNDGVEMYDIAGNYLGNLVSSDGVTGIDFPEQMARALNGNLLVAGFSPTSGVYEYDQFGNQIGIVAGLDFGTRGVYQLGNGEIVWTNGDFTRSDSNIFLQGGSYRFITEICGEFVPTPSGMALLGLGGLIAARRRRA